MTIQTHDAGVIPEWTRGDRLRKARSLTGMTVREFADTIGVSHMTVTNAERDTRAVRVITMKAWALATGVSVEWLEHGEAPNGPDAPASAAVRDGFEAATERKRNRTGGGPASTRGYVPGRAPSHAPGRAA